MNRVGIYFAYWEREWKADFFKYIKKVKDLGFGVLEVSAGAIADMKETERRDLARYADDCGIELTYCIGLPPCYDVSSDDVQIRRDGIEYVIRILRAIEQMKGHVLGGIIYACWPGERYSLEDKKIHRANALMSLKKILPVCEDCGINYCLEIVNRFEQCILNTAQEGLDFLQEAGSPRVKLLLDTFHMNIEEDDIVQAIRSVGRKLGHFHIGENNRRLPGQGNFHWEKIFSALKDIDYKGKIVMEPFLKPGGQVGEDIKVFRDLSNGADCVKLDAMAAESCKFVQSFLE